MLRLASAFWVYDIKKIKFFNHIKLSYWDIIMTPSKVQLPYQNSYLIP